MTAITEHNIMTLEEAESDLQRICNELHEETGISLTCYVAYADEHNGNLEPIGYIHVQSRLNGGIAHMRGSWETQGFRLYKESGSLIGGFNRLIGANHE